MKQFYYVLLFFAFFACNESSDVADSGKGNGGQESVPPGQITAGEWNDLKNWEFWNNLIGNSEFSRMPDYWAFNLNNRISVNIKNQNGENLVNIPIQLLTSDNQILWESKSDNLGNAEFWPFLRNGAQINLSGIKLKINDQYFPQVLSSNEGINQITLATAPAASSKSIEIAYVVDATGSMGDELEYLKVELNDVIARVKQKNVGISIRTGSVFYRDINDAYVTRKIDFSTDISQTVNFISQQKAAGGGDFPESVHTALNVAVNQLQWTASTTSKIIFLILDAPPHYEPQIISEIHELIYTASQKGIRIIPITASGIDKETEFLMRYFSISTNGTYVFITGDSGIGEEHLKPSVGEYQVEFLNDLMVRLINNWVK